MHIFDWICCRDATPPSVNSRTRVHEYGGGSFYPIGDRGDIITCDFATQGLKLIRGGKDGAVFDLVKNSEAARYRYADFVVDTSAREGDRLVYAVREDHTVDEPSAVVNTLVCFPAMSADGSAVETTPESHSVLLNIVGDPNIMFSNPRLDPTGEYISWVQWSHPNMPWDNTELFVARLSSDGKSLASEPLLVAGGVGESTMEPLWCRSPSANPDKHLIFISDRSDGWWNIHRADIKPDGAVDVHCVLRCIGYEFGRSAWQFGYHHYDFLPSGDLVTNWTDAAGVASVIRLDPLRSYVINTCDTIENVNNTYRAEGLFVAALPRTDVSSVSDIVADCNGNIFFLGGGPSIPASVFRWGTVPGGHAPFSAASIEVGVFTTLRNSITLQVDPAYMSNPELMEFPTVCNGAECTAFGWFYRPTNPAFQSLVDIATLPPLLVKLHGGPTGKASTVCRLDIQFFTSRGFAVLDVDYGGSSGYGREYRNRMQGNWGVVDVDDCCRGASFLGEKGFVDSQRLAIQGGSAGGYTALASVAFRDSFHAATSSYGNYYCIVIISRKSLYFFNTNFAGIGDLEALLRETHKFESRYMDGLIGPYPESKPVYESRCPVRYVDDIKCPILFLHGKEDPVCPPNQATDMYAQLVSKGVPTCLLLFDGESHGWRKAETICAALAAELSFYGRVFGFIPDTAVDLDIVGLK